MIVITNYYILTETIVGWDDIIFELIVVALIWGFVWLVFYYLSFVFSKLVGFDDFVQVRGNDTINQVDDQVDQVEEGILNGHL
jgi:hypothetical protein